MTTPRFAAATLALLLSGLPLGAQSIDGTYDFYRCNTEFGNDGTLTIAWPVVTFYAGECTLTASTPIEGMENTFIYDAACSSEGENDTRRMVIVPNYDGGVVVIRDGFGQSYARCEG